MRTNQQGFTLTELLTVVLMIGILSAMVLPKFTKMIDSFRVMEAERMVLAIRGEQEQRCILDKKYTQNPSRLGVLPSGVTKDSNTFSHGDFTYTLSAGGLVATNNVNNYTLELPSYTDGRICCDNCTDLNRNYRTCAELTDRDFTPDYQQAAAECQ